MTNKNKKEILSFDKVEGISIEQLGYIKDSCKRLRWLKEYEGKPVTVNSICVLQGKEGIEYLLEGKGLGEFQGQELGVHLTQKRVDKMYKK